MQPARSAFAIRDFRLLIQSRLLFSFAVQIQALVMGWQVYELTKDPLYLGLIGLMEAIPALSLAPLGGHIVDRSNPLKVYRNVIRLSFLSALILVAVSGPWKLATGITAVGWIYAAALVTGTARAFAAPALYSLVPQLVSRPALAGAAPWISGSIQLASVTGPALGGALYAWKGPLLPYGVDCVMLLSAWFSLSLIRHKPELKATNLSETLYDSLTSGLRYVFGHQLLLSAMALDMFAVLFGGAVALLPVFSAEILKSGPTGLGILRAAPSFGAILMTLVLIHFPVNRAAGKLLLAAVAGFGACIIGFALSQSFWLSVFFLSVSGALDSVSMVVRTAIVQLSSPDEMRGRIAAVNSIFIGSSNEIGAFESGLAAKLLGTVPSVIFGGSMTLLTVLVTAIMAPKLRRMNLSDLK